ncbi:sodium-dependent transporter [Paludibacterium paludis]|uniref:Transporter n=1 Tax=Paludibacterium paludis TaxID=1225769 RepID=A0A918P7N0_9NEIS|nr:sodium-dependent transporter [Paludibacterium paludis]GGY29061.1 transporter [Paludibacterium paludis]
MTSSARSSWGSKLGFIFAAAGSAIGLGAIWKFPYVTAMNGGGAFLVLFLFFSFTLGLAQMVVEFTLGRHARRGPVGMFRALAGGAWPLVGMMGILAGFVLYSFYSVVGGWTLGYVALAVKGDVLVRDAAQLGRLFDGYAKDPLWPVLSHGVFVLATLGIVVAGIEKGIERAGKLLMPALFGIMLILIARSLTLPHAIEGVRAFFMPDFSKVSPSMVVDALGLAFFSLSLGTGGMIAYGSYVKEKTPVFNAAIWVVGLSTVVALLSGLMIFPALFAFGLNPAAGPGLTFMTMPIVFASLPFGQFFAIAFFALLAVAALTSSVSMLELIATLFLDEFGFQRRPVILGLSAAVFVCGIPASLSFGPWHDITVFGKTLFEAMDYSVSNLMMPLGGIAVALFAGWRVWPAIESGSGLAGARLMALKWSCRVVAPVGITVILLKNL